MMLCSHSRVSIRVASRISSSGAAPRQSSSSFNGATLPDHIQFPDQTVFVGTDSLSRFVAQIKPITKRPLVVTDKGLQDVGIPDILLAELKKHNIEGEVCTDSEPNPSCSDVVKIAHAYRNLGCDSFLGLGGGGPLDAMKISGSLIAQSKVQSDFSFERDGVSFITQQLPLILRGMKDNFKQSLPPLLAVPTTSGTGSEGGKSSVITNPEGHKKVYGHPTFMPRYVALAPQLTKMLPPGLTVATGIDALSHLLEAWFVPPETVLLLEEGGTADGYLSSEDIAKCDNYALEGIELVVKYLPTAYKNGSDLDARLRMQIAALLGAKAFRKGDLGGVHATAHAIGAHYHLHHGTAISRMLIPVVSMNERKATHKLLTEKFKPVHDIFLAHGYQGHTLSDSLANFLGKLDVVVGLKGLSVSPVDVVNLTKLATADPCQTNPVPLTEHDYNVLFHSLQQQQTE